MRNLDLNSFKGRVSSIIVSNREISKEARVHYKSVGAKGDRNATFSIEHVEKEFNGNELDR